jgi:two-component system chemotaxis response regulator CheB
MPQKDKIKLLIVDDSALVRLVLKSIFEQSEHIEVVGTAIDPIDARRKIKLLQPDVLTLDIEMPKMDGLTFLDNLMRLRPMPVVMVSTFTQKGAEKTLEALRLGACDFVAKPRHDVKRGLMNLANELIEKVTVAAQCNVDALEQPIQTIRSSIPKLTIKSTPREKLIAFGASTGGTEAINYIISKLPTGLPPIVITQHIPDVFSTTFVKRLDANSQLKVVEVREPMILSPSAAYMAPGNQHLRISNEGGQLIAVPEDGPPVNRHKPAVDVMFNSIVEAGIPCLGILLTGMGSDGAKGLLALKQQGNVTIVQDQQSSVVWGMPGVAAKMGAAQYQMNLAEITEYLNSRIT